MLASAPKTQGGVRAMLYPIEAFQADYPDDAACLDRMLRAQHGGDTLACPSCRVRARFYRIARRRAYACQSCGHHIYPCAGTLFAKSRTRLTTWFYAMYLLTGAPAPMKVTELQRQLGVTYKCAWRMAHAIRALREAEDAPPAPRPALPHPKPPGKPRPSEPPPSKPPPSKPRPRTPARHRR
jgi:transposase-like protein